MRDVTGAELSYQVHPDHAGLVDDVIDWYDDTAAGLERTALPCAGDEFALQRWAAHGYQTDPAALGDDGGWTQLNQRDLTDIERPALPGGFRFRTADEAGPQAAVQAHLDAWAPSSYTAQAYENVRRTAAYRGDLHILVEAPDGTMAASTIMWLDEANSSAEFEPVGTHPSYRRGVGAGDDAARDASGAGGRRRAHDGGLPGRAGSSGRPRTVLRPRFPRTLARRAAHQARRLTARAPREARADHRDVGSRQDLGRPERLTR